MTLIRAGKPPQFVDFSRRDFLLRLCQGAGATFIPSSLWNLTPLASRPGPSNQLTGPEFVLRPRYRSQRALDATLLKVQPGSDRFVSEKYADQIATILASWSSAMLQSPQDLQPILQTLADNFSGASPRPAASRAVRSSPMLQIRRNTFEDQAKLPKAQFVREWQRSIEPFTKIHVAEFQITSIELDDLDTAQFPRRLQTQVHYEFTGTAAGQYREQRVGNWHMTWEASGSGEFRLTNWRTLDETQASASSAIYADITAGALGRNSSYAEQMLHGTDYWRTVLDGACGIDIYGHNGVSVADIDGDGLDDLYVCQPAGLPNRLYHNRGDGTFEDITEASGLGILENTACALFADFNNDGRQDVILVRANGPLLFLNQGSGKFKQKPEAFRFANSPQGTFTGAAVADYDRDGWLDVYFCLYSYYQGTGQYRYPSPYHDAENGPPNFLMRNQGDGTFRDVTMEAGLNQNNTRYSFCCGWNDYNRDGWPDLYVVNDFGRKNLYRNNGDGTFTDVAAQVGAEDVGAGMGVSWLDYDNDGSSDLYVANMWTAAGLRVSSQEIFKKESSPQVRELYHKHAMGNSLLHNHNSSFNEVPTAGVGIGRWAWSSDAFDFDHDGFPDLYVANGMVSGPSRTDLNSFFWRQVVANSPDRGAGSSEYEQGWNAINELLRADGTWSGYERNVFYANNRDGTFSDVSAVVGLDFIEDSRAFALADFDQDGRQEIFLKNRNAPQIRALKNVVQDLPPAIVFRLQGMKSNRDAIGASITIITESGRQTRTLQAGSGFLSQHSKEIFFGLGDAKGPLSVSVWWPSGTVQDVHNLPLNHRIWLEEGKDPSRIEPFRSVSRPESSPADSPEAELTPVRVETWLLAPVPAPDFSLPDVSGQVRKLSSFRGKAVLLYFWTTKSAGSRADLKAFEKNHSRWSAQGLQILAVNVDDAAAGAAPNEKAQPRDLSAFIREQRLSFSILHGSDHVAAIYNLLYRQLFDRHRDLSLPTSFLIDAEGSIVKIYQGPIVLEHLDHDFKNIPTSDSQRLTCALPFSSPHHTLAFGRNYLSSGAIFFQRGYLDQAEASFQQALRDDPSSAEALYGIGSVYLNQNKNAAAREMFERCVKQHANYADTLPDAWNNIGVLATREGRIAESIGYFERALKLNPDHLLSLNNLGSAYRTQKRWDDARKVFEHAVAVAPNDAEANYGLGIVYAQTDDTTRASQHLQRALKSRPDYPEALNNLGVLYLVTRRRDEAVASFKECIRVAPTFDQAYLNLARIYALEGARDQARTLLNELLKQHPDHPQARQMLQQLQP